MIRTTDSPARGRKKTPASSGQDGIELLKQALKLERYRCVFKMASQKENPSKLVDVENKAAILALWSIVGEPMSTAKTVELLRRRNLSECITEILDAKLCEEVKLPGDRRPRFYKITDLGNQELDKYLEWAGGLSPLRDAGKLEVPDVDVEGRVDFFRDVLAEGLRRRKMLPSLPSEGIPPKPDLT